MLQPPNNALRPWRSHLASGLLVACAACGGGGGDHAPTTPPPVVIVPPAIAPSIGTQPQNASAVDGAKASFSVTASGTAPLSYQWQLDGKSIDGATQSSYTTAALRLTDSGGQYRVVVSNAGGSVNSNAVVLTVQPIALSVGAQPKPASVADGAAATFSVEASGSGPIEYQWTRGGSSIAGATGPSYTTPALSLVDSKSEFQVLISNPAGTVASDTVAVTVTPVAPMITNQPVSLTVADQGAVKLTAIATGSAPQSYQWKRNGSPIPGANSTTYSFSADFPSSGDRYSVTISNIAGTVDSQSAVITVNPMAATFSVQPLAVSVNPGASASFSVAASGTAPLSFQWQRSMNGGKTWSSLPGATGSSYKLGYVTLADAAASFRVQVSNPAATVSSQAAVLGVVPNVRVLAGALGGPGYAEGLGAQARFNSPNGVTVDKAGNIYVAESSNFVVRRIAPNGQTMLYAGKPGVNGSSDGKSADARFWLPSHLALDSNGNLFVAELCSIRKITADGMVSTVAGRPYECATPANGQGTAATFGFIRGLATDAADNLYVSDGDRSQTIRKISATGLVTTVAGTIGERGFVNGMGSAARFSNVGGIAFDSAGTLFVIDGSSIRSVAADGSVSLYAGLPDSAGTTEGSRLDARFIYPSSLGFDQDGNLFVTEQRRIVRISKAGLVLKAVGVDYPSPEAPLSVDGPASAAVLFTASGIARLPNGNMVFAQSQGHSVRVMSANASVTTLAGLTQQTGAQDGAAADSRFHRPQNVISDGAGGVLLVDRENYRIRRINAAGQVSTLAGSSWGNQDGAGADIKFSWIGGIARDSSGNVYVADSGNQTIRKISPAGVSSTFAGKVGEQGSADGTGTAARFNQPLGLAVDASGNVFVSDSNNQTIRSISPTGVVSTVAGRAGNFGGTDGAAANASFSYPGAMAFDSKGALYIADSSASTIRKLSPDGIVSTFAGAFNAPGLSNDIYPYVRLYRPIALAFDAQDNLYVADSGNNVIRRITPDATASTVVGSPEMGIVRPGPGGTLNTPAGVAVLANGRLVIIAEEAVLSD